jgi:DNA-binding LacI/PurR family transcriptional regulator
VLADNIDGARQATELLIRTGCRKLAYVGHGGATFSDRERYAGCRDAVARAGARLSSHAVDPRDPETAFQTVAATLSSSERPDGIFCASDVIAFTVMEAARALNFSIPDDLSVIGFNNVPIAASRSFRLSTVDFPIEPTIAAIMELLDKRFADPQRPSGLHHIPTRLVVRATTRERPKNI